MDIPELVNQENAVCRKVSEAEKMKVFLSYVGYVYGMKHDYENKRAQLAKKINQLGIKKAYLPSAKPVKKIAYAEPLKPIHWAVWVLSMSIYFVVGPLIIAIYQYGFKKHRLEKKRQLLQEKYDREYEEALREWEREEEQRRENFSRSDDTRVDKEKIVRNQYLKEYNVIEDAIKDLDRYLNDAYNLRLVHPDYMTEIPVKVMLHYFDAGMVDTLKEALKEYIEYMRHEEIKIRLDVIILNQGKMMDMMATTINLVRGNNEYLRAISECQIESLNIQREQLDETKKTRENTDEINRRTREMAFYSEVSAFCDAYMVRQSRR